MATINPNGKVKVDFPTFIIAKRTKRKLLDPHIDGRGGKEYYYNLTSRIPTEKVPSKIKIYLPVGTKRVSVSFNEGGILYAYRESVLENGQKVCVPTKIQIL